MVVADILGDTNYMAMAYGGYRMNSRDVQPSVEEIKEDLLNPSCTWRSNGADIQCSSSAC